MFRSAEEIVLSILAILIIIIFIGSLYAFFYAIFQFIFSAGDPEKIKKAWNSIRYMILGIIMTIMILFIFPVILNRANFSGYETFNAQNIFRQATIVGRRILNLGKESMTEYQGGSAGTVTPVAPIDSTPPPDDYNDLEL